MFHSISMHQDGSLYMSGTTASSTSGTDFAVFHLDSDGRELWTFQVGFKLPSVCVPPVKNVVLDFALNLCSRLLRLSRGVEILGFF